MQIFVQTGAGNCTTVMVQPSDTIAHIKAKVKEEEGLPPDEQFILSLDGKLLEDGCTVNSYNLQNGSKLFGASGMAYSIYRIAEKSRWIENLILSSTSYLCITEISANML